MSNQREIDLNKLSDEQFQKTMDALGSKIKDKIDSTCDEINGWLSRYAHDDGKLKCKIFFEINTEEFFNEASRYNKSE